MARSIQRDGPLTLRSSGPAAISQRHIRIEQTEIVLCSQNPAHCIVQLQQGNAIVTDRCADRIDRDVGVWNVLQVLSCKPGNLGPFGKVYTFETARATDREFRIGRSTANVERVLCRRV